MSKNKRASAAMVPAGARHMPGGQQIKIVNSLLDAMVDGIEYQSIVGCYPPPNQDAGAQVKAALRGIEILRGRPCIAYVGNVVKPGEGSAVDSSDDVPFAELTQSVPPDLRKVDVFLATNGGSGQQVVRFVNSLRARFDEVDFIIPSVAMSAGTLFALSGDRIWMNPQAALGPVDPQIPTRDGRFVPAQALLLLVAELQQQGDNAMKSGAPVPWSAVRIIDSIDKKELGDAITASQYASNMASQFLNIYKFRHWTVRHSSMQPVTPEYRWQRAQEVGNALVAHERWKSHGHSISRDTLWNEVKLKIDHPDPELERAIRRAWAVFYWVFEKSPLQKILVGQNYAFFKHAKV